MWWLLETASAAPPPPAHTPEEEEAKAQADQRYGKPIPWAAICFAEAKVLDAAPARVVGVRKLETGCEPYGVLVGGAWFTVEAALPAVVPLDRLKALPPPERDALLLSWVDQVWLPFAAPSGTGTVAKTKAGWTVTRSYLRRNGRAGLATDATVSVDFDPATGTVSGRTEAVTKQWQTFFFVQKELVTGMPEDVAQKGMESSGGAIQKCWEDAWEKDRTLAGAARLEWTVGAGKATAITEVNQSTLSSPVVTCIGNALQRSTWPAETTGKVRYVFNLDRRAATP